MKMFSKRQSFVHLYVPSKERFGYFLSKTPSKSVSSKYYARFTTKEQKDHVVVVVVSVCRAAFVVPRCGVDVLVSHLPRARPSSS